MDILVDTNLILHFRRLDELDWCELAGTAPCRVIITPVLMRELERNKVHNPNAKLRQRARDAITWLADRFEAQDPISLREDVTLVLDEQEPLIDFAEHRLSRDIMDDHLIASGLDWAQRSNEEVAIATSDSGLALKLRSRPISYLQPAEKWRLPDAVDAERTEVRELRRQLERERSRRPNLTVQFDDEGNSITVGPEPVDSPRSLEEIRAVFQPMTLHDYMAADDSRELGGPRIYSSEPIDAYNHALHRFFEEYAGYLVRHAAWGEQESRTIELAFSLANIGSAPASNIDVRLNFPSQVELLSAADGPEEPDEPTPPQKPRPNSRSVQIPRAIPLGVPFQTPPERGEGEPQILRDGRAVDYFFRALKHDCASHLEPVLVRFPSRAQMKPFEIEVSITCNEADRVADRLVVRPAAE
jgi:rRNA-processing protein FCF1